MRFLLVFFVFLFCLPAFAQDTAETPAAVKCWIFFKDKGPASLAKANAGNGEGIVSERSLRRRAKVRPDNALLDETDLPVYPRYIAALERGGITVLGVSKWLNAASAELTREQFRRLSGLPYVRGIRPVTRYRRSLPDPDDSIGKTHANGPNPTPTPRPTAGNLNYGFSAVQNVQLNADSLHALNISGQGVFVGMLDSGFLLTHKAFQNMPIIAQYDFIHNDTLTADQPNANPPDFNQINPNDKSRSQQQHGTQTLGCIGAFLDSLLIGTGYGTSFAFAKTEIVSTEITAEEDNWVRGIEWLDSLGVDIASSSLGYADGFVDSGAVDYTFNDLDGKKATTTIAAEIAFQHGILVFNSAGNERGQNGWNHILTPADGANVIAVGAVDHNGVLASFSSPGPTADNRIKPELVAMGVSIYPVFVDDFVTDKVDANTVSGTSFSCPLLAGVGALVLSAHPNATPTQVRNALIQSGDRYINQTWNNDYGYGIPNAVKAALSLGTVFSNQPEVAVASGAVTVKTRVRSNAGIPAGNMKIKVLVDPANPATSQKVDRVMTQTTESFTYSGSLTATDAVNGVVHYYFEVVDGASATRVWPAGAPVEHLTVDLAVSGIDDITDATTPDRFQLAQNYPNPFNPSTTIAYRIPHSAPVRLIVYDLLGRRVRMLMDMAQDPGEYRAVWDGRNDAGMRVSSGVYLYRLTAGRFTASKKMLLLY